MRTVRLLIVAFLLANLAGLAVFFCVILPRFLNWHPPVRIQNTATIVQQVQTLSQLVTVKYVVEKVVIINDPKWFDSSLTDNRLLMVAHGVVKAGVDLSEIKSGDVEVTVDRIVIKLPHARIMDTYLDERLTEVVERSTGLLRSFDKDLEQNARQQAVEEISLAARQEGILKDAEDRAKSQLTVFFHQFGDQAVEFR